MSFLKNIGCGCGDDNMLFFILIFLCLFCGDMFGGCGNDNCGNDGVDDNSILFFIILFLLLFNGNGIGSNNNCGC